MKKVRDPNEPLDGREYDLVVRSNSYIGLEL